MTSISMLWRNSVLLITAVWVVNSDASFGNQTSHENLPVLRSGQICTPGKAYRVDCNTCRCGPNNILLCTKMACLNRDLLAALMRKRLLDRLKAKKHQGGREGKNVQVEKDKSSSKDKMRLVKREGSHQDLHQPKKEQAMLYPELPVGNCEPGKIYQVGCNRCFCDADKEAICAKFQCDDKVNLRLARTPQDVRPPFTKQESDALPSLSHSAAKCQPGKAYTVDCNTCLCLVDGNTLCGDLLCVSNQDMNRQLAKQLSGVPCNATTKLLATKGCVECACVDGKQQCEDIPDCAPEALRMLHGEVPIALDKTSRGCVPKSVYKDDCNRCYCQMDRSMRCTRKKCLNYVQVKKLLKVRLALEKSGQ